jgi:hypothetical protein
MEGMPDLDGGDTLYMQGANVRIDDVLNIDEVNDRQQGANNGN